MTVLWCNAFDRPLSTRMVSIPKNGTPAGPVLMSAGDGLVRLDTSAEGPCAAGGKQAGGAGMRRGRAPSAHVRMHAATAPRPHAAAAAARRPPSATRTWSVEVEMSTAQATRPSPMMAATAGTVRETCAGHATGCQCAPRWVMKRGPSLPPHVASKTEHHFQGSPSGSCRTVGITRPNRFRGQTSDEGTCRRSGTLLSSDNLDNLAPMHAGISCLLGTPEAQRKLREAFPPGGAKKKTVDESAPPAAAAGEEPPPKDAPAGTASQATIQEGAAIPSVVFKCRVRDNSLGGDNPFAWKDVSTADIFAGKRVAIFALPGAFTPTCSSVT